MGNYLVGRPNSTILAIDGLKEALAHPRIDQLQRDKASFPAPELQGLGSIRRAAAPTRTFCLASRGGNRTVRYDSMDSGTEWEAVV
jgi:hypothetical protein